MLAKQAKINGHIGQVEWPAFGLFGSIGQIGLESQCKGHQRWLLNGYSEMRDTRYTMDMKPTNFLVVNFHPKPDTTRLRNTPHSHSHSQPIEATVTYSSA